MKLDEIRSMLVPGSLWLGVRTPGWPAGSSMAKCNHQIRKVLVVRKKDVEFEVEGGRSLYTPFPRAKDLVEARDGYLKFTVPGRPDITVELTRQPEAGAVGQAALPQGAAALAI